MWPLKTKEKPGILDGEAVEPCGFLPCGAHRGEFVLMDNGGLVGLDKEVIKTVTLLNSMEGIETNASCSGHGYNDAYIAFTCNKFGSLLKIVDSVYRLRWECGDRLDVQKHLWIVDFSAYRPRSDGSILLAIRYQDSDTFALRQSKTGLRRIKMKEAWRELENSLERATLEA